MYGSKAPQGAQYYCRGCGEKLPPDCHAQFHPACLKADKRRRTQERRQLEQERFLAWLARQKCPACGATMHQDQAGSGNLAVDPPRAPGLVPRSQKIDWSRTIVDGSSIWAVFGAETGKGSSTQINLVLLSDSRRAPRVPIHRLRNSPLEVRRIVGDEVVQFLLRRCGSRPGQAENNRQRENHSHETSDRAGGNKFQTRIISYSRRRAASNCRASRDSSIIHPRRS